MSVAPPPPLPFDVVRAVDLVRATPEQRWLVESLWADQGVGFIGGTPKSLKSWIGLDLAATGRAGPGQSRAVTPREPLH